jgi:hypothetical protein
VPWNCWRKLERVFVQQFPACHVLTTQSYKNDPRRDIFGTIPAASDNAA